MIVEDWKVGLRVKEDVKGDILVKKCEIVKLVCEFMDLDSDLTRDIREKSRKFKKICGDANENSGSANALFTVHTCLKVHFQQCSLFYLNNIYLY